MFCLFCSRLRVCLLEAHSREVRCCRRWAHAEEYQGLKAAVEQAVANQPPPGVLQPPGRTVPRDERLPPMHQATSPALLQSV